MASLLERMNLAPTGGPVRAKPRAARAGSAPYARPSKGDSNGQWSHDLFESHNSLSARLNLEPAVPKASLNNIAQKALKDAVGSSLSIKGASTQGNIVEVAGLLAGTTPDDVAAIFQQCGVITDQKLLPSKRDEARIRLTFKTAQAATKAVQQFNNQPADGKTLSVKVVGASSTTLGSRLSGRDGPSLAKEEGSVDVLMSSHDSGSKMRSDELVKSDPRAHVLVAPPGANPADYVASNGRGRGRRGGRGSGRGGGRGRRGGKMMVD